MKIAFAIPVAQTCLFQANKSLKAWESKGYHTAVLTNGSFPYKPKHTEFWWHYEDYIGWAWANNIMARELFTRGFDWIVFGGHDITPDPDILAGTIAEQLVRHFKGTNGVMQPCGDDWGAHKERTAATSPWVGKQWWEGHYGSKGPFWEGYTHYYGDTELTEVATREHTMWWRSDLTQFHDHYLKRHESTPDHLVKFQDGSGKILFDKRKAQSFPGSNT